jgi:Response regulators consisting of a CheY-like receiver domain and a winged-helix DNA-binding domain
VLPALLSCSANVVILDLGLPDLDGLEIARALRAQRPDMAIIMLTARSGPGDRLLGWREGADAYLVKPVEFKELEAVIQSVARRSVGSEDPPWVLQESAQQVRSPGGRAVRLSPTEVAFLALMVEAEDRPVSAEALAAALGEEGAGGESNRVPAALSRLRKKLEGLGEARLIVAVRGEGYRFGAPLVRRSSAA